MKKMLLPSCAAFILTAFTFGAQAQLSVGLKAYYPFSGNANDASGNNHHCTMVGSPSLTQDRQSYANCAYAFPGDTNNYLKVPFASDFDIAPTGAFSISLWFNGYTPALGDFESLFDKRQIIGNKHSDYHLALYDGNIPAFGGPYSPLAFATSFVPDNKWHHLTGVYDNSAWKLYVDSALAGGYPPGTPITQSSADILIGIGFNGKIDDIRFYDRALSASEVQQIFLLGSSCAPNGINEAATSVLKMFPVPAGNELNIVVPDNFSPEIQVCISDLSGKTQLSQTTTTAFGKTINLELPQLATGIYIVTLTDTDGHTIKGKCIKE